MPVSAREGRKKCAPVAQLDRVPGYEPGGRGFESYPAHQKFIKTVKQQCLTVFCYPRPALLRHLSAQLPTAASCFVFSRPTMSGRFGRNPSVAVFVLTNTGLILYELMFKRKRAAVVAKQGYE